MIANTMNALSKVLKIFKVKIVNEQMKKNFIICFGDFNMLLLLMDRSR